MKDNPVHSHLAEACLGCQNFVADIPNLARPPIQVHWPGLRWNDPSNSQLIETAKDSPTDPRKFIAYTMVFIIRNVTGGALNILAIHNFDDGDNTPGKGINLENALPFFLQRLTIDIYKANIIRTDFKADLSQVCRRKLSPLSSCVQITHFALLKDFPLRAIQLQF
jgi:hypothetical protein